MGCGKSHAGAALSESLGMPFIDMDHHIETSENLSITQLFATKGEDYFRQMETKFLKELSRESNAVISTGGGSPCFNDNIEVMDEKGITVFLDTPIEIILERLRAESDSRPLIKNMEAKLLEGFIKAKIEERRPFYEQANFIVKEETTDHVISKLSVIVNQDQ